LTENLVLFLVLLNSIVYPNACSGLYFLFALSLTALSLTKEEKKAKLKFVLAICLALISAGLGVTKGAYLIMLND
jgi:hypothetical protein